MSRTNKTAAGLASLLSEPKPAPSLTPDPAPESSSTPAPESVPDTGAQTAASTAADPAPNGGGAPDAPAEGRGVPWPPPLDDDRVKVTIVFDPEDYAALQWLTADTVERSGIPRRKGPSGGSQADVVRTAVELLALDPDLRERLTAAFLARRQRPRGQGSR